MKKQNILKGAVAIAALVIIYFEGRKKLKNYDINQVMHLLSNLNRSRVITLFVLGLIAVSTMTFYDYFLIKHLRYKLSFYKIWKVSWVSNTFNNFLGFAGMTGATIRTLLYKKNNISTGDAVYASVILAPSTVIGISAASWLILFNVLKGRPILNQYKVLWFGVVGFAIYLPIYILMYRWKWLNKKVMARISKDDRDPKTLREKLIASSLLEWICIGLLFWFICLTFTKEIKLLESLGIVSISAIAGIMSFIPGGMGSFDLICILGLRLMGATSERAMAILVVFRVFYYIIPWFIGIILGISEIITNKH
ncbi:hypothetical protein GOM49_12985 [Clostridium bovifaecis]|uniref:Phosphatidylglycerol lysyltransferase n=1 Tax=Clostridium bovifaecis TaxID=2184719 RepID=A0A6I6F3X0_9CLOT|nr:hypothetical protein GOM49_12985 [Clostridium bovifaecis]